MKSFAEYITEIKMPEIYNRLKHSDITKRPERVKLFLDKLKNGGSFLTVKGEFIFDKTEFERIEPEYTKRGYNTAVKGRVDGKRISLQYPKDFFKAPDFGGQPKGKFTAAEDRELVRMQKKLAAILKRDKVAAIDLKIGKRTVECAAIISTPQVGRFAPKSDFSIVDSMNNQVGWISHKDGKSAKDFQQYGGMTDEGTNGEFKANKDFKDFITAMMIAATDGEIEEFDGLVSGDMFYRPVKDPVVARKAVYGMDYGKSPGINNVDEFHLGEIIFKGGRGKYSLDSKHKGINGEIPTGDFAATYVTRYQSPDQTVLGMRIPSSRTGIFTAVFPPKTAEKV
jgi:hypothetical protein